MKKNSYCFLFLFIICLLTFSSCQNIKEGDNSMLSQETSSLIKEQESSLEQDSSSDDLITMASTIKTLNSNKTYLEVDGKPFAIRGGQVRIDGLLNRLSSIEGTPAPLTKDEIEKYFIEAKQFHLNTLELPIDWRRIEIEKDVYDFTLIDILLSFSNKYDLKCEFLWFGTNMCGDSHEFQLPDYIINDPLTYQHLESNHEYVSYLYGKIFWLVLNNEKLMEREAKVLEKIMDHVYEWNKANGNKNPLIGVQVHNESDGFVRWRLSQKELKLNGEKLTPKQAWNMTLEALNNAGLAIKKSNYKVYTRCNMTVTLGVKKFPQFDDEIFSPLDVLSLPGIDIVGDDPYVEDPTKINKTIKEYSINGNYPHIAENMGNYASSPEMFLTAYQAGGSYMFYDLATPTYFIYVNGNGSYQMDQGIINPDFSYKEHSYQTRSIVQGIEKMGSVLPLVESSNFAAFNVLSKKQNNLKQTICTNSLKITYETNNGSIGYAIENDGYLYVYSTDDCKIEINNASFNYKVEIGYFNFDEFVVESTKIINPTILIEKEKLYKIKIRNINEKVISDTNKNV